jgi:hypothetical protein
VRFVKLLRLAVAIASPPDVAATPSSGVDTA